jgi:hypothetical protein
MNDVFKTLLPYNTIDKAFKLACKIPWNHQIEKNIWKPSAWLSNVIPIKPTNGWLDYKSDTNVPM